MKRKIKKAICVMILLAYAITFGNNTALANTNVKYDNIDNQLKRELDELHMGLWENRFVRINTVHTSECVPAFCHPWQVGCGRMPSWLQGSHSISYTVPQSADRIRSTALIPRMLE